MKAPIKWLKEYIDFDLSANELQEKLTNRGLEVSGIEELGAEIKNVVVGKINDIKPHPDADKLVVCSIDAGEGDIQIVTGANNISVGDYVPVAKVGSHLPGGVKIKKGKLRGVESFGMLCSGSELNITNSNYQGAEVDGIMILQPGLTIGEDIKKVIGLDDIVLEVEPTPDRPDWLSIIGIAREIASIVGGKVKMPNANEKFSQAGDCGIKIDVENKELCTCYLAKKVVDIKIKQSPRWMIDKLNAAGVRSINNIVDITNYVMLETGQPMHAFDFACVDNEHIIVRNAKKDEKIITLDGKEHALSEDMLLIADENKGVGIAGVMGGENSEITEQTKTILFESAKFNGPNVRKTSKALAIPSEAALRFSKGINVETTAFALARACELIENLGAGKVVEYMAGDTFEKIEKPEISFTPEKINAFLGLDVSSDEMLKILNSLEINSHIKDGVIYSTVPSFRGDVRKWQDISEEICRVYGYDKIPMTLMKGDLMLGSLTDKQKNERKLKQLLLAMGAYECLTYSFTGPNTFDKLNLAKDDSLRNCVKIMNPFGEDNSLMRSTMITGMVNVLSANYNKKISSGRFFEFGVTHTPASKADELPCETKTICIGIYGKQESFFTLKGMLETAFESLGLQGIKLVEGGESFYHAGRKARIVLGDDEIGSLGQIDPKVADNFGLDKNSYFASFALDAVLENVRTDLAYLPIPKYPFVSRDIALVIDDNIAAGDIFEQIKKSGTKLLKSVELFDVYKGENIGKENKSLAYSLKFSSDEKTLTDNQVNEIMSKILKDLEERFDAKLRK